MTYSIADLITISATETILTGLAGISSVKESAAERQRINGTKHLIERAISKKAGA